MIQSNSIIILIIFSFQLSVLQAQNTFVKWISTPLNEFVYGLQQFDNSPNYLLTIYKGNPLPSNPSILTPYSSYHLLVFKTNEDFEIIDSLDIKSSGTYAIYPAKVLKLTNNSNVIAGLAYDSVAQDFQVYLAWFDDNMDFIKDSLYGLFDKDEYAKDFFLNNNGNIIFYGLLDPVFNDKSNVVKDATTNFFMELDDTGEVLQFVTNDSISNVSGLLRSVGNTTYYHLRHPVNGLEGILQLNSDFSVDTAYYFPVNNFYHYFSVAYDDTSYFALGDIYKGSGNPAYPGTDMDYGFIRFNVNAEVLNYNSYGIADTTDRIGSLSFTSPDTLFIGGSKNMLTGYYDSWFSLYKTNLEDTVYFENFYGGYGKYYLTHILATSDGGCIIAGTWWDFYNFPDPYRQQDVVIMKVDANGLITGIGEQAVPFESTDIIVYPNPGTDHLKIASAKKSLRFQLFDLSGNLIIKNDFDNTLDLNTSLLKNGTYLYSIHQQGKEIKSGKWIKK